MAITRGCKRKRKRERRPLVGQKVEVRSKEEGFEGSWHSAVVTEISHKRLRVEYDHILAENGFCKLVESINVSPFIDGLASQCDNNSSYHGKVRPQPPSTDFDPWDLLYGLCVDVYHNDAWWEGVIFDHNFGHDKRRVLFPEGGDELLATTANIRLTQDWNEVTGKWHYRGAWLFLELMEIYAQELPLPVSLKQIWYDLRCKDGFRKNLKEWTCCDRGSWKKLLLETVNESLSVALGDILPRLDLRANEVQQSSELLESTELACEAATDPKEDLSGLAILLSNNPPCLDIAGNNAMQCPLFLPGEILRTGFWEDREGHVIFSTPRKHANCYLDDIKYANKGGLPRNSLTKNIRNHCSHLGWKEKGQTRFLHISSKQKLHDSLLRVCQHPGDSKEISSGVLDDAHCLITSPDNLFMQLSKYPDSSKPALPSTFNVSGAQSVSCPEAIVEPGTLTEHITGKTINKDSNIQKTDAKRFSLVAGVDSGRVPLQLDAPPESWPAEHHSHSSSKEFPCLGKVKSIRSKLRKPRTNIQWHIIPYMTSSHLEVSANAVSDGIVCKEVLTKRHNRTSHCNKPKQRECQAISKFRDMEAEDLLQVEKVRQGSPSPLHRSPRNVLSWLIDNDVVLPRAKVHCIRRRRRLVLTEGRISRDGIKCSCCSDVFTLSKFCLHASNGGMAASSIILEDGRSLLTCQLQILRRKALSSLGKETHDRIEGKWQKGKSDIICSICHYGGELILCDHCPSAFHKSCLGLQEVPDEDWLCLSCRCGICGQRKMKEDDRNSVNDNILICFQCECAYHIGCLREKGMVELELPPQENWYCSKKCKEISEALHELLGKRIKVGAKNITWTLLRSTNPNYHDLDDACDNEAVIENDSKLSIAVEVMHECFEPLKDCYTERDIIQDVIFSRGSKLGRLNFQGFYTILLEKGDEVVTVGTVRVHGEKVAEIPLIGTRFQFRRLGMCRILMGELEKRLKKIGVCKLILPAVPCVLNKWTTSFGFTRMKDTERLNFLDYNFLAFQDTIMCQKQLVNSDPAWSNLEQGTSPLHCDRVEDDGNRTELDGCSSVSEVLQVDPVEVGIVDQCLSGPIVKDETKVQDVVNPISGKMTPFAHVYKRYTHGKRRKLE